MVDQPLPMHPSAGVDGLRVGNDLIAVEEVRGSIMEFGDRYLHRVFTEREIAYCQTSETSFVERFAARFAAKEAVLKILRPVDAWPPWREIEIVRHAGGWCDVRLSGSAAALAARDNVTILSCSLSHDSTYASAVVMGHAVSSPQ